MSSGIDLFASLTTTDQRTLTPYGAFRGVEVWAAVDDLDNPCLFLVEEASQRTLEGVCTPHSGDLIADVDAWPRFGDDFARELAAGTVFRFQQRGTAIDAFVIQPSRAPWIQRSGVFPHQVGGQSVPYPGSSGAAPSTRCSATHPGTPGTRSPYTMRHDEPAREVSRETSAGRS